MTTLSFILTLFVAILLSELPIPDWAVSYWPVWPLLALTYWHLALPGRYGIKTAWLVGLIMDLIKHSLIGQHAFTYAVTAYVVMYFYPRFRIHPLLQQALSISVLLFPYFFLTFWFEGILYPNIIIWQHWTPLLGSVLVWPWVFSVLRFIRYRTGKQDAKR